MYLILWIILFTNYIIIISVKDYDKKRVKILNFTTLFGCFAGILVLICPITLFHKGNISYAYGPAVNVSYVMSSLCIVSWIIMLLRNYKNMKSKKVFLVLKRKALKMLSYVNDELYKELYPRYLRKIGINIPEDYREGKSGYIDPSAYFDGSDYRLISIGKNTTISRL